DGNIRMRKGINSFIGLNDNQAQWYLAACWPPGKLTAQINDSTSTIYKYVWAISDFIKQITAQMYQLAYNLNIMLCDVLLPDWETSAGIPANVPRLSTVAQRQTA